MHSWRVSISPPGAFCGQNTCSVARAGLKTNRTEYGRFSDLQVSGFLCGRSVPAFQGANTQQQQAAALFHIQPTNKQGKRRTQWAFPLISIRDASSLLCSGLMDIGMQLCLYCIIYCQEISPRSALPLLNICICYTRVALVEML
jgi:hypothetical protein